MKVFARARAGATIIRAAATKTIAKPATIGTAGFNDLVQVRLMSLPGRGRVALRRRPRGPDYRNTRPIPKPGVPPMRESDADVKTTEDRLLGGRVVLHQPAAGYRAAIDPVLLAAAVPARPGEHVLDLGCGMGAAALALAARLPAVRITGLERDPTLARLCARNIEANKMAGRVEAVTGDLLAPPAALAAGSFDHAMANPPFLEPGRADLPPDPGRRAANVEGAAGLDDWIAAALAAVKPKGWLTLIHRADRLDALLGLLGGRAGAVTILPLWPRAGEPAKRVILRARKGARTPSQLLPGLVLHEGEGFTAAAQAILRDGAALPS
jgi:tRNA1(Val) A37 N6-methylase TrmN6